MKKNSQNFWYFALIALYVLLSFTSPVDPAVLARYGISEVQARLLTLTIIIPLVAIWLAAYYGFLRIKGYADYIKKTDDGASFNTIAKGLRILAYGLVISSIISSLFTHLTRRNDEFIPASTIISNYLGIAIAFAAFTYIYTGVKQLTKLTDKPMKPTIRTGLYALYVIAAGVYIYQTLTNPARTSPAGNVSRAAFYLPDWLIILTIILPYLYIWYIGLRSAVHMHFYATNVKGTVYRRALSALAWGVGGVVSASIIIQYLSSFSTYVSHLNLQGLLLLIYLILIAMAVGYVFIAVGARRLQRIEEV